MTAATAAMAIAGIAVTAAKAASVVSAAMAAALASASSSLRAPGVPRAVPISGPPRLRLPPLRLPRRKEEQTNVNA